MDIRENDHVPARVSWLLNEGYFGYLATASKDGSPHITPIIFVYYDRHIFFVTSKVAKKLKNIKENCKVAFLIDVRDPSNLYNNIAVLIQGTAKVYGLFNAFLEIRRLFRIRSLFMEKYPKYFCAYTEEKRRLPSAWQTTLFLSRILVRINPENFTFWSMTRPINLGEKLW